MGRVMMIGCTYKTCEKMGNEDHGIKVTKEQKNGVREMI
jgi:hypothetical protein